MNRRNFIKNTAALSMLPLMGSSMPFKMLGLTHPLYSNPCDVTDRALVIVYLNGGNDIFNTNVPLNQFDLYANIRPEIHISENNLITLDSTLPDEQQLGLHPVLTAFKNLYDNGKLKIVQGVGYDQMNRSHFKSVENWWRANGGSEQYSDGWLSRFLYDRYPSFQGVPFGEELDPLGLTFASSSNAGFHTGEEHNMEISMSGKDDLGFYSLISTLAGDPIQNIPDSHYGQMLTFLDNMALSLNVYAGRVQNVFNSGVNHGNVTYPDSSLGSQLKTIAKMMSGGSRTKIFVTSKGGFDNHANIINVGNSSEGRHADLLRDTFDSIKAFQDDLDEQGLSDKVLTVVFSEFGRKAIQNGSLGVDHGSLSNVFLIGNGVQPGVVGNNMNLSDLSNGAPSNEQMQFTFHRMYAGILQDWLGANDNSINNNIFPNAPTPYTTQKPDLINPSNIVPASCYFVPQEEEVCACMQIKIWLEGFYDINNHGMHTYLSADPSFPLSQPFNAAPYNYNGIETISSIPDDTVDWVLIELREIENSLNVVARQAVLLRKDGFIMQTNGQTGSGFTDVTDEDYYLAVFHRNHLAVLSSESVEADNNNFLYDFTISDAQAKGVGQLKALSNTYVMIAGDIDHDNYIDNRDHNSIDLNQGTNTGYNDNDVNGDNNVDTSDHDLWYANRYKIGALK